MMPAPRITTWEESDMPREDGGVTASKETEDFIEDFIRPDLSRPRTRTNPSP